jgi:hypothetical protein
VEGLLRNEELFRSVNEQIAALTSASSAPEEPGFVCECTQMECAEHVTLSLAEFEEVRAHDRQYVVMRGHELDPAIERVVRARDGFLVVEKIRALDIRDGSGSN